jgi:folate-binding protein YgfZ
MWNAANKILGILHLNKSDSGKFRPLEINFDKQRVSFEKGCFRGQEIVARMKYLGIDRRRFCTFIVKNDFVENNLIKSIGEIINLDDKKIFNGIVKKDDIEEVKKISGIISIL